MPEATKDEDPVIEVYKSGIDVSLIRENLRRSVEERFIELMRLQDFAEELQKARKSAEHEQQ